MAPAPAGALLKLADLPAPAAVAAVNPTGDLPDRIAHLEGQPPTRRVGLGWLLGGATLANLAGALRGGDLLHRPGSGDGGRDDVNRYCVGPAMAVDWGEEGPPPVVRRPVRAAVPHPTADQGWYR